MPIYQLRHGDDIRAHIQAPVDADAIAQMQRSNLQEPGTSLWEGERLIEAARAAILNDDDPIGLAHRILGAKSIF
jgi:hypothetical protein